MPTVNVSATYQVLLTNKEYTLITKALAGILHESDRAEALTLNVHLCHLRAHGVKIMGQISDKALEAANALLPETEKEKYEHSTVSRTEN